MGFRYTVQQGDCLSSIAKAFGFLDFEAIYSHAENAAFREERPNPNVILPGDKLYIPDLEPRVVPCSTDQLHQFRLKRSKVFLRLRLEDDLHQPFANTKYRLRVEGEYFDGTTDGDGMMEQQIPAEAQSGEITLLDSAEGSPDEGYTFTLQLGHLDPIDTTSGVDDRLMNLGFSSAEGGELSDDDRTEAIKAFQDAYGLEVTGALDDDTRQKLREMHDGE
jgi:hypothetical protein